MSKVIVLAAALMISGIATANDHKAAPAAAAAAAPGTEAAGMHKEEAKPAHKTKDMKKAKGATAPGHG